MVVLVNSKGRKPVARMWVALQLTLSVITTTDGRGRTDIRAVRIAEIQQRDVAGEVGPMPHPPVAVVQLEPERGQQAADIAQRPWL